VIVSDAGPLIVLLKTNKLSILKELFGTVNVPTAVFKEITAKEQEKAKEMPGYWLWQLAQPIATQTQSRQQKATT
jgi:predicted nucleic acid-binding protein